MRIRTNNTDYREQDRVRTPLGMGTITGTFRDDPKKVDFFRVTLENGVEYDVHYLQLTPETFGEFLTRPGHIGKTRHGEAIAILLFVMALEAVGIRTFNSGGWVAVAFGALVVGWFFLGTWLNFKRILV